jgi:hypothetical protein
MPKAKPTPLSDSLLPKIQKGEAAPAPEPGKLARAAVSPKRISTTYRITEETHEALRRLAFELRIPQQALVDEGLELVIAKRTRAAA